MSTRSYTTSPSCLSWANQAALHQTAVSWNERKSCVQFPFRLISLLKLVVRINCTTCPGLYGNSMCIGSQDAWNIYMAFVADTQSGLTTTQWREEHAAARRRLKHEIRNSKDVKKRCWPQTTHKEWMESRQKLPNLIPTLLLKYWIKCGTVARFPPLEKNPS